MSVLPAAGEARRSLEIQGQWSPYRQGYRSMTTPTDACSTTLTLATGRLYLAKLVVDHRFAPAALDYYVSVAATTPTAGQCFAVLFDAAGAVVASKDAVTDFGSAGVKSLTLAGELSDQDYRFGLLFNGTTGPQIPRSTAATGGPTFFNANLAAAEYRGSYVDGQTSVPSPVAYASATAYIPLWAAIR